MWGNVAISFSGEPSKGKSVPPSKASPTSLQYRARQFLAVWAAHSLPLAPWGEGQEDRGHEEGFLSHVPSSILGAEKYAQGEGISEQDNHRLAVPLIKGVVEDEQFTVQSWSSCHRAFETTSLPSTNIVRSKSSL